jgi:hypothetical protein
MKRKNLLLVVAFAITSFFSVHTRAAIQPNATNYIYTFESVVGVAKAGTANMMFRHTPMSTITGASYSFAKGAESSFSVTSASISGGMMYIVAGLKFTPTEAKVYEDTLIITMDGEAEAGRFPLKGTGIAYSVSPVALQDFGPLNVGTSSATPKEIIVTGTSTAFAYNLQNGAASAFSVAEDPAYTATAGGKLKVTFNSTVEGEVTDTLIVSSGNDAAIYKVPLKGTGVLVAAAAYNFQKVAVNATATYALPVTIAAGNGVTIATATVDNENYFTVTPDADWSATTGGKLILTFTPTATVNYSTTLTISGTGFTAITAAITGVGSPKPVITSDPESVDFGDAVTATTKNSVVTVYLENRIEGNLSLSNLSLAKADNYVGTDSIFKVVGAQRNAQVLEPNTTAVTISFNPKAAQAYKDTLIVRSQYADELRIPLAGKGVNPITANTQQSYDFGNVVVGMDKSFNQVFMLNENTLANPSYRLAKGNAGQITITSAVVQGGVALVVSGIKFTPTTTGEYLDTLIISTAAADEAFRFPLKGNGITYSVSPVALQNFGNIAAGVTSAAKQITVSGTSTAFTYSLKDNSTVFSIVEEAYTATTGGKLNITFTPTEAGVVYEDTLIVSSESDTELTYKVPLKGQGAPVTAQSPLNFQGVAINATKEMTLPVTVAAGSDVTITSTTVNNEVFTVDPAEGWSATTGGDLTVTFTPAAIQNYNATITISGTGFDPVSVTLSGVGKTKPVITSDPESYNFGNVLKETSATSEVITVVVNNHIAAPNIPEGFTLAFENAATYATANDSIFKVVSSNYDAQNTDNHTVTISFNPKAAQAYSDVLIVKSQYADDLRINLTGTGTITDGLVNADATAVKVYAQNATLYVETQVAQQVKIYNISGALVYNNTIEGKTPIALTKGVYVVKAGTQTKKVVL